MKFWPKLKRSGAKIESVSSDMSAAFISAIKKNQTDTIHVFDHFHVQKLAGETPWTKSEEMSIIKRRT